MGIRNRLMSIKTYNQFVEESLIILEKYYPPDEKLPSGRTPLQKATDRAETPYANTRSARGRQMRQVFQTKRKVAHGADNPDLNKHQQRGVEVSGHRDSLRISHPESGVRYTVNKIGTTKDKSPVYDITWGHHHAPSSLSNREKIQIGRDAKDVWGTHVQHRLPTGSVVKNSPVSNPTEKNPNKNTRARLYQKAGFGEPGKKGQFAKVNREPSIKRKLKGQTRLSPLPPNTEYNF